MSAWLVALLVVYFGGAGLYVSVADTRETLGMWAGDVLADLAGEERPPEAPRVRFWLKVLRGLFWPVRLLRFALTRP